MSVSISCPSCNLTASVAEDDLLTATITCAGCGFPFKALGSEPEPPPPEVAGPEEAPRKWNLPPTKPARPKPPPARPRRAFRRLALAGSGLLLLAGLVCGGVFVSRAFKPAAFHTCSPDEKAELEFPEGAAWVNGPVEPEPDGGAPAPAVQSFRGRAGGYEYGFRTTPLDKIRSAGGRHEAWLAVDQMAKMISFGQPGTPTDVSCNNYPAVQQVVRGKNDYAYVFRAVPVHDTIYLMFVAGTGASPEQPHVQRFFDSFRHRDVPPPDANYRRPEGDAFQPLATITGHSSAVFSPKGDFLYTHYAVANRLTQYELPSFRKVGDFSLAECANRLLHLDGVNDRLYSHETRWGRDKQTPVLTRPSRYRLVRHDLAAIKRPVKATPIPPAGVLELDGRYDGEIVTVVPGDGKYLFVLSGPFRRGKSPQAPTPADGVLYRVRAETMTVDRQMTVPLATGGLAASPDGASVYVVAQRQLTGPGGWTAQLWEIDCEQFALRREPLPRGGDFDSVACSTSGQLFVNRYWYDLCAVVPGATEPLCRQLSIRCEYPPMVADGRRVIATNPHSEWLELWDAEGELKTLRPQRLGSLKFAGLINGRPVRSPDGKYLLLPSGKCYLLAGSGDPPQIDPSAKWQP